MTTTDERLRQLPPIDAILREPVAQELAMHYGRSVALGWARKSLARLRADLVGRVGEVDRSALLQETLELMQMHEQEEGMMRLGSVVNATGVVLHTNLGRAPLADEAIEAVRQAARYGNVELELESGQRSYRGHQLDDLWRDLTGAEASLVVNNCAAATILALQALAAGREVIVSRGQLIEIGGSYRLPEVFAQSGAILREVGSTNRTRLSDYEAAIGPQTAALLRVHPSNYRVVGFTEEVAIGPLVELARRHRLLAIDDVGSGCLVDLRPFGLPAEPMIQESIEAGADLVAFSGDKLLGGPQAGVLLGKREVIARVKGSPLARAMRIDKLTLAALQGTLEIHRSGRAHEAIPVIRQLSMPLAVLRENAVALSRRLAAISPALTVDVLPTRSAVGGGSLPTAELDTWAVTLHSEQLPTEELARQLRIGNPRVIPRVEDNLVLLDTRTLLPGDDTRVVDAISRLAQRFLGAR